MRQVSQVNPVCNAHSSKIYSSLQEKRAGPLLDNIYQSTYDEQMRSLLKESKVFRIALFGNGTTILKVPMMIFWGSSGHPQELYITHWIKLHIADKIPFSNPCIISQSIFQTKWLRHDIFSITRWIEPTNVFYDESAISGSIIARSSVNCLLFYVKT